ncbi:MAG: hypothetical protein MOB07_23295 [Acidobacteria bacterium]|nr:hypothetical protein [Acidobacteriota bacterium]
MADADVSITAGSGTKIDTRTVGAGTDEHRQVIVVGDPSTASAVAVVTAADGLDVDPTRLPAGEIHLGEVGGKTVIVTTSYTRPADTTTYAAGDAVSNSTSAPAQLTFDGAGRVTDGSGVILGAVLTDSGNQALKGQFELYLFSASSTPDNDNALFTPSDSDMNNLIGVIPFNIWYVGDATAGAGGNAVAPVQGLSIPFKCASGTNDIFGQVVVRNAYVPLSAEIFTFRLLIAQD